MVVAEEAEAARTKTSRRLSNDFSSLIYESVGVSGIYSSIYLFRRWRQTYLGCFPVPLSSRMQLFLSLPWAALLFETGKYSRRKYKMCVP